MKLNRVLICPDSFKGSLTSQEAAEAMEKGLRKAGFSGHIEKCALSDGGEGFNSLIANYKDVKKVKVKTCDALGREITAGYLIDESSRSAYIESAEAIGIEKLSLEERDPLKTSSRGLGLLIRDALYRKVKDIFISLGGSAVVDGGRGMLSALGFNFNNSEDSPHDATLEMAKNVKFHAVCDVSNPLLGENGAVYVFAPQKGARPEDLPYLEKRMADWRDSLLRSGYGSKDDINLKGGGAAGGIGYALQAVFNADYISGIDFAKQIVDFKEKMSSSDLVLTGEGSIDRQSLMGKVLSGVLEEAMKYGVPVIAFGGKVSDREYLIEGGFSALVEIADPLVSLEENMKKEKAIQNLELNVAKSLIFTREEPGK